MMNRMKPIALLSLLALACVMSVGAYAATGFAGKWKGEIASPVAGRGGAEGSGAPAGGGQPQAPAAPEGGFGRGGGGFGRGGGFGGGGFGGGFGGPQKVTLNLKIKEDKKTGEVKASGNITVGETTDDVKDAKIQGNMITFTAGHAPAPIYQYTGELSSDEIKITRASSGRGGQPVQFSLKRS